MRKLMKLARSISRKGLDGFVEMNLNHGKCLILDLGCGGVHKTKLNSEAKVVGIDIKCAQGVDVIGDAHILPFRNDAFDIIISKQVLEHLRNPHLAVTEMWRVLKPGGKVVMSVPFYYPIHVAPADYFRFTRYGLEILFERWREVKIEAQYNLLGTLALHLIKFSTSEAIIIKIFSPAIVLAVALLLACDKPLAKFLMHRKKSEILTTHYFLSAIKSY